MSRRVVVAGVSTCSLAVVICLSPSSNANATWFDSATGQPVQVTPRGMQAGGANQATIHDQEGHARDLYWDKQCNTWKDAKTGDEVHVTPRGMQAGGPNQATIHDQEGHARDLYWQPCPPPATQTSMSTGYNSGASPAWNGWVGLNGGFATGTGNFRETEGTGDFRTSGGTFGGTLGIGARVGPYKVGLESDLNWANFNGSSNVNCAVGCGVSNHWFATMRPLVGVQIGDTGIIPYLTAGVAFGDVSANVGDFSGVSQTNVGWTAGGGVAFPLGAWLGGRIVGKVEYLHLDFGSVPCAPATCGGVADVKSTQEVFRVGVNIDFYNNTQVNYYPANSQSSGARYLAAKNGVRY